MMTICMHPLSQVSASFPKLPKATKLIVNPSLLRLISCFVLGKFWNASAAPHKQYMRGHDDHRRRSESHDARQVFTPSPGNVHPFHSPDDSLLSISFAEEYRDEKTKPLVDLSHQSHSSVNPCRLE